MAYYVFEDGEALELEHTPQSAREVSRAEYQRARKASALKKLREMIQVKQTIYCVLKSRNSSGTSRVIDFLVIRHGVGGSVGGTPPNKLKVGDSVYFWDEVQPEKGCATTNGKIVRAPKGRNIVTLKLDDGTQVVKLRAQLTIRNNTPYEVIFSISRLMAEANGYHFDEKAGGLRIGGGGMDMGFSAVYGLGCALWPNGTPKPHSMRNGVPDTAGGYAIGHAWL